MGYLDLQSANGSNTGTTTFTALTAATGDTLTVRSLGGDQHARLIDFGCKHATAGQVRVHSPFLHDNVNALRFRTLAADGSGLTGYNGYQRLRGQDTLVVEATGGSSAEEVSYWQLVYYDQLAGSQSLYITAEELEARAIDWLGVEVPVTGGATATWGSALFNSGTGTLKADQVYAIVGYDLDVACTAIGVSGPDTGNFRAGGPGITTRQFTRNWFYDISKAQGLPLIPCINAQNVGGTNVYVIDSAGATAVNVDFLCARIGPVRMG